MVSEREGRRYRLEPLDTSGVFLGLGAAQCVVLGSAITAAVVAVTAGSLPVAVAAVVVGVVVCFGRAGGHVLYEWVPLAARWLWTGRRGRQWHAPLPLWPCLEGAAALPPCLEGLEVVEVPWRGGGVLGAVRDTHRKTLTSVVVVTGDQFVVADPAEQDHLLARWGDVLGQFAVEGSAVAHIGWSDLARPSGLAQHRAWANLDAAEDRNGDAVASYRELLDAAGATATAHEVAVTVTVAADRTRRSGPASGDATGDALGVATEALLRALRTANLTPGAPLDGAGIRRLLRRRVEPLPTPCSGSGGSVDPMAMYGPLSVEARWRDVRVDSVLHRTWWVESWPRATVSAGWLEPFLATSCVTRTMTVVTIPVPARQSRRCIERDLVKLESDAATKEDQGRRVDARHRRATQALLDREEELVAGFPEVAYLGLVTVSASDEALLEDHGAMVEQAARDAGMDLHLLETRQDTAWAAALPLGIGPVALMGR